MFCTNCGSGIDEGEAICKGCGKLSVDIRNELLAMSEKVNEIKCEKCGGALHKEHHYCHSCGAPTTC